ncbi:putative ATPase/DNA-binding CsgD family transcriptional regulator [Streptomyces sp. V4I23]|uniref:ATP-binding protein n=1 Tax=Streptomyces sp. V4I23 TaxID=3042282 RepID=UPI002784B1B4|nr:LuxR C-terminal-related transcriptional regulator [Streptomyces sp. V4I23]MDQ1006890.1 putative ATPase/DNA-binding CsgD family transcriptional regulator [Streptomyces sp. V4I23]
MSPSRKCEECGKELPGKDRRTGSAPPQGGRPARYCSAACRQRAFRRRSAQHGTGRTQPRAAAGTPAPATAVPGRELPRALDSFVGRGRELSRLRALMKSARLLTLTGPGGVGKTRLALEFAGSMRGGADDRAQFVELESLHDGNQLPQSVATALGLGERGGRSGVDVLAHTLGERSMLLILDNCEHLAEPCAQLAAALLSRCPRLRILATSREVLRVPGEVVFRVGELSLSPLAAEDDPAAVLQADAVRLFVERAADRVPGFALDAGNARTVAEICRRLDGMPLAIELAARRTGALPLSDILAGLDDQLALLTDGSRTGPRRHRELAAAIDWSHRLLDPEEKTLFRRLAVLVGGFDAACAAAVCADGEVPPRDVLRVLCALEAKSLIVRLPGTEGPARFRQLSAIRAYALDRLADSGELQRTWQRALDWLTGLLEPTAGRLFADQIGGAPATERENLAAAVSYATDRDGRPPLGLALALARVRFQQEQLTAARALLTQVLAQDDGSAHGGAALALAARAACQQQDPAAALHFAEQAVEIERRRDTPTALANALDARAAALVCGGEFVRAVADFAECVDIVATLGSPRDTASCRHHLAWALLHIGEAAEADELMASCLPVLRGRSSWAQSAAALHTSGAIRLALGDAEAAQGLFAEALRTVPGESFHALYPLEGLAVVAAERGQMKRSLRLFAAASQARRRLDTEPEAEWRRQVESATDRAAAALTPAGRDTAVAQGRGMGWERLIAYALRGNGEGVTPAAREDNGRSPLTGREMTVAALVAEGLTNREIAARLDLSASTVSTHLDNVRDKLGMRSRTRIALWVAGREKRRAAPAHDPRRGEVS